MRRRPLPRSPLLARRVVVGVTVALLVTTPCRFAAAGPAEPDRTPAAPVRSGDSLQPLVRAAAERLQVADRVAAAKWLSGQPIDDPVRERQVLDSVARRAQAMGIDPAAAQRIFRDQIEASKLVQRSLHERWSAHPGEAPTTPPAPGETRPAIDRIDARLLSAIGAVRADPSSSGPLSFGFACAAREAVAAESTARDLGFDALHRAGLARALSSVCSS